MSYSTVDLMNCKEAVGQVVPVQWIESVDPQVLALQQSLANGYFQCDLQHDRWTKAATLRLSMYPKENRLDIAPPCHFFRTSQGPIGLSHAIPLFEALADFSYVEDFPLGMDKWLRFCLAQAPKEWSALLGGWVPCDETDHQDWLALSLDLMQEGEGVGTVLWAPVCVWHYWLQQPQWQYISHTTGKKLQRHNVSVSLFHTWLSVQQYDELAVNDVLLAEQLHVSAQGHGKLSVFDTTLSIQLNVDDQMCVSLTVLDIKPAGLSGHFEDGRYRCAGDWLTPQEGELESMQSEWDDEPESTEDEALDQTYDEQEEEPEKEAAPSASLSCGKVCIDACIGSFSINYEQVQQLQVMDIIPLASSYKGSVSLRNQGVEIGRARIVSVNEQLALQIQTLWS